MSKQNQEREWRTAYWGTCSSDGCLTSMVIYPHPGGTDHAADIIKNY